MSADAGIAPLTLPWSARRHRRGRRLARAGLALASLLALAGGALAVARHLYLGAKGAVAAALIDRAWVRTLDDSRPHRPWPWADFVPIARIEIRRLGIDRPILSDASGRTLAFGLGHLVGSASPGSPGLSAIGGHRDTWAAFLARLERGDMIVVRTRGGGRRYRVEATAVVDSGAALQPVSYGTDAAAGRDRLVLVTCWPFGALRRGTLRYVVRCAAVDQALDRPAPVQRVDVVPSVNTTGSSM